MHIPYDGISIEQIIRKLYWEEELSQELIGKRLGYSRGWVQKMMGKYNIPRRNLSTAQLVAIKHNRKDFEEIQRKAQQTIRYEISLGLRRWNHPGRYKSKIAALEGITGNSFKEILRSLYWDTQMSCQEIAEYLNNIMAEIPGRAFKVHEGYVDRRLKMFGIPRRDISKATKLAMDKLSTGKKVITDLADIFDKTDEEKREVLYDLYWNQNYTQTMIGKKLGVSTRWVGLKMMELDIPRRTQAQSRAMAIREGRINLTEVIRKSNATIAQQVARGEREWNRPGLYGDKIAALEKTCGVILKDIISYMYWECGLYLHEIADSLTRIFNEFPGKTVNLTKHFVVERMRKHEIPRRASGDARSLKASAGRSDTLTLEELIEGLQRKNKHKTIC